MQITFKNYVSLNPRDRHTFLSTLPESELDALMHDISAHLQDRQMSAHQVSEAQRFADMHTKGVRPSTLPEGSEEDDAYKERYEDYLLGIQTAQERSFAWKDLK